MTRIDANHLLLSEHSVVPLNRSQSSCFSFLRHWPFGFLHSHKFVPIRLPRRSLDGGGCLFVPKRSLRFRFDEVRQRFRLTPTEKRVAVFVLAAFVLGLATKCYRDAHSSPTPAARKMEQANSIKKTKTKRTSQKPTTELSDR